MSAYVQALQPCPGISREEYKQHSRETHTDTASIAINEQVERDCEASLLYLTSYIPTAAAAIGDVGLFFFFLSSLETSIKK